MMLSSSMWQWGGLLGTVIGLTAGSNHAPQVLSVRKQLNMLALRSLFFVLFGSAVWYGCVCVVEVHQNLTFSWNFVITKNLLAFFATVQYVLFWALLSYSLNSVIRRWFVSFCSLVGIQLIELFWVIPNHPEWEVVLPTGISRLPISLAYPVWQTDSWAAPYPSLLASMPMITDANYVPLDVGVGWVVLIEGVYLLLCLSALAWSLLGGRKTNELVQGS